MDFAYIFGGQRTTKKPSTLRKKREEPVAKYIDKSRAIAIARQLKITKVGKVTLRINSKNSIDSELPKVPLSDTRMTTRKAILEKQKGLNTAMHTKESAVGKCILKTNDYQNRQLKLYVNTMQEDKERTRHGMKEKKRAFVSRQRSFNLEPITAVDDELEYVQQQRKRGGITTDIVSDYPQSPSQQQPPDVYRSAFNFSLRRQSSSLTSGIFLTTPGAGGRSSRARDRIAEVTDEEGKSRDGSTAKSRVSGNLTRENTTMSLRSVGPSRPSTSDNEEQEPSGDDRRRRSTKRVSILEENKPKEQEKKPPSRRRRGRRQYSVVSLIPKRSPTPTRASEVRSHGAKSRMISPIDELPPSSEYDGNATDDERFTALEDLLVPDSNQEAQLIASEYAKQFAYKAKYSHRRPKNTPGVKNEENVKKFNSFLEANRLRKLSSRSTGSF